MGRLTIGLRIIAAIIPYNNFNDWLNGFTAEDYFALINKTREDEITVGLPKSGGKILFEMQFLFQNIKRRFFRFLLIAASVMFLFFVEKWVLHDMLKLEYALTAQAFTAILGVIMSVFYLLGGLYLALWGSGMMGSLFIVIALPSPWKVIGILAFILWAPISRFINKYRLRRQLLNENPDMTKEQAAEITDTTGAVYTNPQDDMRREIDQVMNEAGLLAVENAPIRCRKQYLLSPSNNGITLYIFNDQQRIQDLVLGNPVNLVSGDVQICRDEIADVDLRVVKRFGIKSLRIIINTQENNHEYIFTGSASAKQIEELLLNHCDIPINNHVKDDKEPLVKALDIVENIKQLDPETVSRMRSSRRINKIMVLLSALSIPGVFVGLFYPMLSILMMLCPVAATVFYIMRQEDVQLDGSRQGKPSVFFSYLCNPFFSGILCIIIFERLEWPTISPLYWGIGFACAIAFLFFTIRFIRENKGKIGIKIGFILIAIAFCMQIAAVSTLVNIRINKIQNAIIDES